MTEDEILRIKPEDTNAKQSQEIVPTDETAKNERHEEFLCRFKENYGISFSKGDMLESSAQEQVDFLFEADVKTAQFLISKERKMSDYTALLKKFKENNPDAVLSIHSSAPKFDTGNHGLPVKNADRLLEDFREAAEAGCELVTIHPVGIEMADWNKVGQEIQSKAISSMAHFYAQAVATAKNSGRKLELAIENLPAKGDAGNWGQTPEHVSAVLNKSREILVVELGFTAAEAIEAIGITLDLGHALAGNKSEIEQVLASWFKELGSDIKCFHVGDQKKLKMLQVLCERFNVDVPEFLESKHDLQTTKDAYIDSRQKLS